MREKTEVDGVRGPLEGGPGRSIIGGRTWGIRQKGDCLTPSSRWAVAELRRKVLQKNAGSGVQEKTLKRGPPFGERNRRRSREE